MNPPQDIPSFLATFQPQISSLANYQFSVHNLLFWAALLVMFVVLAFMWGTKSSLIFCSIVGVLLLGTTMIESYIVDSALNNGEVFDPAVIRLLSMVALTFITIYYAFIGKDR